jgi:V8-like Glu-specific endopeptidase
LSISGLQAAGCVEHATEMSITGVNPIRRPVLRDLPTDFFIENRKNVTVEQIDDNMIYVHHGRTEEREKHIYTPLSSNKDSKQFALLKMTGGEATDRRLVVPNYRDPPYSAICFLRGTYSLNHRERFVYSGTGFRNGLNQIITAGHNLFFEKSEIEMICAERKISLKGDYSFNQRNLTIEAIFGFQGIPDSDKYHYTYNAQINGRRSFTHPERDFGIIALPHDKNKFLNKIIGGLSTLSLLDQAHEYFNREVTIVGYPGEKNPKELYAHSGPVKNVDSQGIVYYEVDTSRGNSGSPV